MPERHPPAFIADVFTTRYGHITSGLRTASPLEPQHVLLARQLLMREPDARHVVRDRKEGILVLAHETRQGTFGSSSIVPSSMSNLSII